MNFIPLHVYSEYSFLNSGLTLDKYFSYAKKYKYSTLGISDYQVLFGLPTFNALALDNNITPVFGMDIKLGKYLLSIYVQNEEGYLNLIQITNFLQTNDISYNHLLKHQNGLIFVLSLNVTNYNFIDKTIERLSTDLKNFYIGVEIYNQTQKQELMDSINKYAKTYRLVAFPFIQYIHKEDAIVLDIVDAIKNNTTLDITEKSGDNYFRSLEEITTLYGDLPLFSLSDFTKSINFTLKKHRGALLEYVSHDKAQEVLKNKCYEGLKSKDLINNETYAKRLNTELDVIHQMGFDNYFLIVEDYVNYAKTHDILVGPGRGSAAGSLVSFALNITTPDPIKYDLYFERFLNASRKTMPDIDIDFEDIKRDQVVNYLKDKYGKDRVANIVTFQTIGAKQALRDIGRVFNFSSFDIDYLSKALGIFSTTFAKSYRTNQTFKTLLDKEPHFLQIVRLASKIEGLIRQSSIHAAGVILNNEPIENTLPVLKDASNNLIAQYEMTYLEEQGFLKMDLLSLRNLTIIKDICNLVNINPYEIPIDDDKAINIIKNNLTMGIFQLESNGMRNSIDVLKPSSFADIAALIALFRPGPMDNIQTYALRKERKEKFTYLNKIMEKILAPTYGIIIYQEQIMKIATDMGGLSLEDADNFRRAISKKDLSKIAVLKGKFILGALKNGYKESDAKEIYETIVKFASYGFNKAHSISYAYICSQMAYLKAHYPLEFYATILEHESGFTSDKMFEYLKEIKMQNINLLLPNINESTNCFKVFNGNLMFPLNAIRGLQTRVCEVIINEREKFGKFKDFFDFVTRLYKQNINEAIIMRLIDAGAFDEFANRATLRASIANAINQASFNIAMDVSLLNASDLGLHFDLVHKEDDAIFNIDKEYEALGIMISTSPLKYKHELLVNKNAITISKAKTLKRSCLIGVMLLKIKTIKTKKGDQMAYLTCNDETGDLEVVVFPREYSKYWNIFNKNNILLIKGYMDDKKPDTFVAQEISKLED